MQNYFWTNLDEFCLFRLMIREVKAPQGNSCKSARCWDPSWVLLEEFGEEVGWSKDEYHRTGLTALLKHTHLHTSCMQDLLLTLLKWLKSVVTFKTWFAAGEGLTCLLQEAVNHSLSVSRLILHLTSLLCSHSLGLSVLWEGPGGLRQLVWHSRAKGFGAKSLLPSLRRSRRSAAKRLLEVAQNCFMCRDYWSQRCKGIKYTFPMEEAINNIPSWVHVWKYERIY